MGHSSKPPERKNHFQDYLCLNHNPILLLLIYYEAPYPAHNTNMTTLYKAKNKNLVCVDEGVDRDEIYYYTK